LADNGLGNVAPNPMVGCVIVHKDRIIGEGYHREFGKAHAEVNAIESVKDASLFPESTLYVNLEPCSHHGKTPPCADLIIAKKIPRVVIGQMDPNPEVAGNGIKKLKAAWVDVTQGVLEEESKFLNRRFNTFHIKKRPYIILKWAESSDGFVDVDRSSEKREINWISHPNTQKLSHSWRAQEMAILSGSRTINLDDPSLTTRAYPGKNPLRIVLERINEIRTDSKVLTDELPSLIFNPLKSEKIGNKEWIQTPTNADLDFVLSELYSRNIQSLIVEGGPAIHAAFINSGNWDEARIIKSVNRLGSGLPAAPLNARFSESYAYGEDLIQIAFNR
jgi:diaminohydroxyphosphoribosylaminopyrimidine deaminase/5-amino-6-(5-phosphoribosylamino)uracil reductase